MAAAVSVVLPTYNRINLLPAAVDSVLAQTFGDFELIVVDDGSTDGTAEMLAARHPDEPRLRVLAQANAGTSAARNAGVRAAAAPLVAYIDSDDLWRPGFLAAQRAILEAQPAVDLVLCDADYEGHTGRDAEHLFGDPDWRAPLSGAAMCRGAWALPTTMMLRTAVARALPFREDYTYAEDTEFLYRFFDRGHRAVLNPERLAVWRHHAGGDAAPKTVEAARHRIAHLRMLDEYGHLAEDPQSLAALRAFRIRQLARGLMREGRWAEARPYLKMWWKQRPLRPRTCYYVLRSLFAKEPT